MKKDDYLATLMQIPPKQKMNIESFSQKTAREAFSVSLEGLKGVCIFLRMLAATHATAVEHACVGCRVFASKGGSKTEG